MNQLNKLQKELKMSSNNIVFKPIGIIHTEFKNKTNVPIQPRFSNSKGTVEIFPEFTKGLKDLDAFSHIVLIYYFHESKSYDLEVKPYLDEKKRGVFATCAPRRPNNIGVSVVELEKIEKNILYVNKVDMIDKTPLLDIKPYIHDFDTKASAKQGWIKGKIKQNHMSDDRFG